LQSFSRWQHHYDGKLKTTDDLEKALSTMLGSLHEPTTGYTSAADVQAQAKVPAPDPALSPLGLTLAKQPNGTYTIDYLAYGSPAYNSDLRTGDLVTSIGGTVLNKDTAPQAADALTRVKTGDKVEIAFRHDGKDDKLTLTSAAQPAAKVAAKLLPNQTLFIRLPDFSAENLEAFENTLVQAEQATKYQLPGLVLDLRGNPGGDFNNAIDVAGLFIADGPIVSATTREGRLVTPKTYMIIPPFADKLAANPELAKIITNLYGVPMVVLTDHSTGGSAEIVAAALKDNKRAAVVGESTYGRNVVANREELSTGGVLSITAQDYVTPAGTNLSGKGLAPNTQVSHARAGKTDEVLEAGVKELTAQMAAAKRAAHPAQSDSDDNGSSGFSTKVSSAFAVAMLLLGIFLYALYERQRKKREADKKAAAQNKKAGR
jgi:carboxyl-terminal processing protease